MDQNTQNGGIGMLGNAGMGDLMGLMRDPSGIEDMLLQENENTGDSPAAIFADLVNVQRADTARLAAHHGVQVDVQRMTPERAAELLAGTVSGDGVEIVEMFNEEAERRDRVLQEILDDDEYDEFMQAKTQSMFTTPAGEEVPGDGE